jgi:hypothetical protein
MTAMAAIVGGGEGSSTGSVLPEVKAIADTLFQLTQELSIANKLHTIVPQMRMQALNKIADDVFANVDQKAQHANNWMQWNTGVTVEEFQRFFKNGPSRERFHRLLMSDVGSGLDATTRELVIAWVERWAPELWPGEVGSGLYTTEQLNYFMKIQRLLATHRGVTAPTLDKLAGPVSGSGRSAGEAKVVGLAAKHEYTVLDTKSDHLGRRFIQVRNPWAEYVGAIKRRSVRRGRKGRRC